MKWFPPNNHFFVSRIGIAIVCMIVSDFCRAQNTYTDTAAVEVVDTATAIEEVPNYFDYKTSKQDGDTLELRHVPVSVMDSLKNDDAFWYANTKMKRKEERQTSNSHAPPWVKNLIWAIIVGAFLAALVWYLATSNILIFTKRQKQIVNPGDEQEMPEDIFAINYQKELDRAIGTEDYRLAVRLMFLRLLKNLSNRNIIQYKQGRTNFEYLSQSFSTGYYSDFFRLTRNYEYVWYGKFDVSPDAFRTIKMDFENFDHRLK